jgi:hypothetical protein
LEKDIGLYVTYANTLFLPQYRSNKYNNYFNQLAKYFSENNIAVIGTPYDFFYSKELFYDSEYHLNQEGVTIRTRQLIEMMTSLGIVDKVKNASNPTLMRANSEITK